MIENKYLVNQLLIRGGGLVTLIKQYFMEIIIYLRL